MNSTTLRGVFPDPKPVHRRNFLRENIRNLREMQGLPPGEPKGKSQSLTLARSQNQKYHNIQPRVYSTAAAKKPSKSELSKRPMPASPRQPKTQAHPFSKNKSELMSHRISHRGVQTERPEDVERLYETGVLKYPSPGVLPTPPHKAPKKGGDQGDSPPGDKSTIAKQLHKLDLDDKHNKIKPGVKQAKPASVAKQPVAQPVVAKTPESPPKEHKRGVVPKYIQERKQQLKSGDYDSDAISGLVLLPDDERKEYLRVARENYATLIKELNSMPVSNDTLKKRKRKMEIEDELERLDGVIKIFQKPKVFVKADV